MLANYLSIKGILLHFYGSFISTKDSETFNKKFLAILDYKV